MLALVCEPLSLSGGASQVSGARRRGNSPLSGARVSHADGQAQIVSALWTPGEGGDWSWVAEHARIAWRSLPGGISVLGLLVHGPAGQADKLPQAALRALGHFPVPLAGEPSVDADGKPIWDLMTFIADPAAVPSLTRFVGSTKSAGVAVPTTVANLKRSLVRVTSSLKLRVFLPVRAQASASSDDNDYEVVLAEDAVPPSEQKDEAAAASPAPAQGDSTPVLDRILEALEPLSAQLASVVRGESTHGVVTFKGEPVSKLVPGAALADGSHAMQWSLAATAPATGQSGTAAVTASIDGVITAVAFVPSGTSAGDAASAIATDVHRTMVARLSSLAESFPDSGSPLDAPVSAPGLSKGGWDRPLPKRVLLSGPDALRLSVYVPADESVAPRAAAVTATELLAFDVYAQLDRNAILDVVQKSIEDVEGALAAPSAATTAAAETKTAASASKRDKPSVSGASAASTVMPSVDAASSSTVKVAEPAGIPAIYVLLAVVLPLIAFFLMRR